MKKKNDAMTSEVFRGLFKNNFQLVNQAIRLGRFYIKAGHDLRLNELLDELKAHPSPDYIKDLQEAEKAEAEEAEKREAFGSLSQTP
jgi:hypothetical protein